MSSTMPRARVLERGGTCRSGAGASFVELLIALSIVGVALLVMLHQLTISHRENDLGREKIFAYQKALGMLAELQSSVDREAIPDGLALEAKADLTDNPVLTTLLDANGQPLGALHAMSGNHLDDGRWRWYRRVTVEAVPAQERMRYVRVQLKRQTRSGKVSVIASVAGMINLPPTESPAIKAYDVYLLALAASPSTWQPLPVARTAVESASEELMARNPGLSLRLRWITRYGYGRDPLYTPYVNRDNASNAAAPWAYWYPGKLARGASNLFVAEQFGARIKTETGIVNGYHATTNARPYSVADQFNHAMRSPLARELFDARVQLGLENRNEPPLQLLLDDLVREPQRFANSIFVNLHGDGLPFPPLRNYSDPAKDPAGNPDVRVVTHPARLRTPRDPNGDGNEADTKDLELRVYAYKTDPAAGANVLTTPITVQIFGGDLTQNVNGTNGAQPTTLHVRRLRGGVDPRNGNLGGPNDYYAFDDSEGRPPLRGDEPEDHDYAMTYECGFVAGANPYTWLRLYNTPITARPLSSGGLATADRLWGLEYVPSPVEAAGSPAGDFPRDLATTGSGPKNTARWRIRIPKGVFATGFPGGRWGPSDTVVRVVTRIGTDLTTGTAWPVANQPLNVSTTWAWWARSPDAVPVTERYQFAGDPRHNPYVDLVANGDSFAHGYNWYFDDLRAGAIDTTVSWPAFDGTRLRDGFGPGVLVDVPRMLKVWRDALLGTSSLFTNVNGRLAGNVLRGGEIALPPASDGDLEAPTPVLLHGSFYGSVDPVVVDSLTEAPVPTVAPVPLAGSEVPKLGEAIVCDNAATPFWARSWLGELFPDSRWTTWQSDGNLATSAGYRRVPLTEFGAPDEPPGTDLARAIGARLHDVGAASLIQIGSSSSTLAHAPQVAGAMTAMTANTREMFMASGIGMPDTTAARLPFGWNEALSRGLPHTVFPDYPDLFAQELQRYADGPGGRVGFAALRVLAPVGGNRTFLNLCGITPTTPEEHDWLARAALLMTLRTFHVAGEPALDNGFDELPRVLITAPPNDETMAVPTSVLLRWRSQYLRFDGLPLTANYPTEFSGDESDLVYVILYSSDGGSTWRYAVDNEPATPGVRPTAPALLQVDQGSGDESFLLNLPPADFPAGHYQIRVECHHRFRDRHMSHHTTNLWITR